MDMPPSHLHRHLLASAAVAGVLVIGWWVILHGHPHEDAYILFTYVKNLAAGHGIVYFPGAAPSEGATDFLWLLNLSLLHALGIDVVLSALLLNAAGAYLATYLLVRHAEDTELVGGQHLYLVLIPFLVVLSPLAEASYGGFSTLYYSAASLLMFHLYLVGQPRTLVWVPVAGVVLGLIRPDGVLLGVLVSLLGMAEAHHRGFLRRYLAFTGVAFAVGAAYFVWRFNYFGFLLPLPLYVKVAQALGVEGVGSTLAWANDNWGIMAAVALTLPLSLARTRRIFPILCAAAGFVAILAFSHQSQNVASRFQAPATVALLLTLCLALPSIAHFLAPSRWFHVGFPGLAIVMLGGPYLFSVVSQVQYLSNSDYINAFPAQLSHIVDSDTRIALTEAGRLAFWTDAQLYDLVGLNTPHTALNRASVPYLESLQPDVIMLHTAGTLRPTADSDGEAVIPVRVADIRRSLRPPFKDADHMWAATIHAPLVAYEFLAGREDEYELLLARYGEGHQHLYAVRSSTMPVSEFESLLRESFELASSCSYWRTVSGTPPCGPS